METKNSKYTAPYIPEGRTILYMPISNQFMAEAKEYARVNSLDKEMPNTSVIVKDGVIIGRGANGSTYHQTHICERVKRNIPTGEGYELCEGCHPKNHGESRAIKNAKEILKYYASRCPIALVTGGHPPFQLEKLKKAGIEPSIFSKIAIPEDSIKQPFYREFAKEFLASPADVWVCGDRIPMDLKPAHELGFNTVHMRWGRGLQMAPEPWIKYSIADLSELRKWIK